MANRLIQEPLTIVIEDDDDYSVPSSLPSLESFHSSLPSLESFEVVKLHDDDDDVVEETDAAIEALIAYALYDDKNYRKQP